MATRGFHSITLTLEKIEATAKVLTDIFGYRLLAQEGNRYRFQTDAVNEASIVDLLEEPNGCPGSNAAGTNHHVAFRVANETVQMEFREKILSSGLQITPKIDRDYFFSLYFREPGGGRLVLSIVSRILSCLGKRLKTSFATRSESKLNVAIKRCMRLKEELEQALLSKAIANFLKVTVCILHKAITK